MRSWKVALLVFGALAVGFVMGIAEGELPFTKSDIASAQKLIGLEFSDSEIDSMQADLGDYLKGYDELRKMNIPNEIPPALVMNPVPGQYPRASAGKKSPTIHWTKPGNVKRPANLEEVAFWSVRDLAELIRTKQVSSTELTQMYLAKHLSTDVARVNEICRRRRGVDRPRLRNR